MSSDALPRREVLAHDAEPTAAGHRPAACGAGGEPLLLLLVPLRLECLVLAGAPPGVTVLRTGMGRRRAEAAAAVARLMPARAVAVAGFCGGLTGDLRPGDVVVATGLSVAGGSGAGVEPADAPGAPELGGADRLTAALRVRGVGGVHEGLVVSSPRIVRGAERARLAAGGALAVDMESAWLQVASGGRPCAVLRVVLDTPATRLCGPCAAAGDFALACTTLRRAAPALLDWALATSTPRV
jgi:4-hydroxy-3-methylbut-2-enyl diphosphate reductase